jgi:hypothetical protein
VSVHVARSSRLVAVRIVTDMRYNVGLGSVGSDHGPSIAVAMGIRQGTSQGSNGKTRLLRQAKKFLGHVGHATTGESHSPIGEPSSRITG